MRPLIASFALSLAPAAFSQTSAPTVDPNLEPRLTEAIRRAPCQVNLFSKNLDTGAEFGVNPDVQVRTASTIKLAIMIAVFGEVEARRARWTDEIVLEEQNKVPGSGVLTEFSAGVRLPLRDLVHLMIVVSDNTATNLILTRITADTVNRYLDALGFPRTRSIRKINPSSGGWSRFGLIEENQKWGIGVSTPRDMVGILEKLERGQIISEAASKEMIAILKRQQYNDGIGRRLGNVKAASKSGALDALRSDVGIVYSPGGRVAIAITCDGMKEGYYTPDNPGLLLISQLAGILLEGLAPAGR